MLQRQKKPVQPDQTANNNIGIGFLAGLFVCMVGITWKLPPIEESDLNRIVHESYISIT